MRQLLKCCAASLIAAGCASTSTQPEVTSLTGGGAEVARGSEATPAPARTSKTGKVVANSAEHKRSHASVDLSEFFQSRAFKKRLAESYLSDTDVELTVTVAERDALLPILDLITANPPKLDEAAKALTELRRPDSSAVLDFTLANIYFQKEDDDKAIPLYKTAVGKHPKFRRAWGNLGQVYYRQGNYAGAIDAFAHVVQLGGADGITFGLLGVCHAKSEDYVSAESAFRMATVLDPATKDWKLGLAESLFRQQRYADAAALFGTLLQKDPSDANLWLAQGEAYARLDKTLEAAQNFEMVDRLGASTFDSLNNLGDIYAGKKLFDLAVDSYLRALKKKPGSSVARAVRGAKYLSGNGALDQVAKLVTGIQSLEGEHLGDSDKKQLYKLQARVAVARGADDEEAAVLAKIVDLDPMDGEALILLGQHARRTGNLEKAVFYYERAENIEAVEAEAKLRHAQLLVGQRKYDEAAKLLRAAQQIKFRDDVQDYLERIERFAKARS